MRKALLNLFLVLACAGIPAQAAELKKETAEAFEKYAQANEARLDAEVREGKQFLWVDRLPEARRSQVYAQIRQGEILVEEVELPELQKIEIPHGLVHHWVAVAFVPGATLQQTLALLQDYDNHQNLYKPDVQRSKLLSANGNEYKVYFRLYRKAIVTAIFNTEFDIQYFSLDGERVYSRGHATRIAEVENPGQPDEREKAIGRDRGFLWRLNTYWRLEEKDGGVYVQSEFVSLSRTVPWIFAWFVNPLLRSVPREYLTHLLDATRVALTKPATPARADF